VRIYRVEKHVLPRSFDEVLLDGELVRLKVGPHGAKPEVADVIRVADATGRSARSVAAEALVLWSARRSDEKGP